MGDAIYIQPTFHITKFCIFLNDIICKNLKCDITLLPIKQLKKMVLCEPYGVAYVILLGIGIVLLINNCLNNGFGLMVLYLNNGLVEFYISYKQQIKIIV